MTHPFTHLCPGPGGLPSLPLVFLEKHFPLLTWRIRWNWRNWGGGGGKEKGAVGMPALPTPSFSPCLSLPVHYYFAPLQGGGFGEEQGRGWEGGGLHHACLLLLRWAPPVSSLSPLTYFPCLFYLPLFKQWGFMPDRQEQTGTFTLPRPLPFLWACELSPCLSPPP